MKSNNQKKSKKNLVYILLIFILLICLFLVQCALKNVGTPKEELPPPPETKPSVTVIAQEKPPVDTLPKDTVKKDSVVKVEKIQTPKKEKIIPPKPAIDSAALKKQDSIRLADSIAKADSLRILDSLAKLPSDSIPPTVSLIPPPGRYYEPIKLKARCDEIKCNTWISIGDTNSPQEAKKGFEYNKTGTVFFRAQDSAGNFSAWQTGEYDMASDNRCGKNAYPVPVNGKEVCVDAYEYPNKADEVPKDMVSHEEAASLCAAIGKRLCELNEWQAACKGREKDNRYSYGTSYIPTRCNSNTKAAQRSGRKNQCRSWWGMYDMNGNLWEWTATKSKEKETAFLVVGGSWSGNNQTRCTESSYSFYPQNQYPSVGFRCCKD